MLWLIPAVCALLAVVFASIGLVATMRAWHALQEHAERLQAATPSALLDSARLETAFGRIGRNLDGIKGLLDRAAMAVREIAAGLSELRLREAMVALRVAGVAVRALRTLF